MIMLTTINLPGNISFNSPDGFKAEYRDVGSVLGALLPYFFWFGGLLALVMFFWAGFDLLLGGGNPEKMKAANQRILWTVGGTIAMIAAYWIIQLVEIMLGVGILQ